MANLKLAMVVSLVDRLTAPAKKAAAAQGMVGRFGDTAQAAQGGSGGRFFARRPRSADIRGLIADVAMLYRWPLGEVRAIEAEELLEGRRLGLERMEAMWGGQRL